MQDQISFDLTEPRLIKDYRILSGRVYYYWKVSIVFPSGKNKGQSMTSGYLESTWQGTKKQINTKKTLKGTSWFAMGTNRHGYCHVGSFENMHDAARAVLDHQLNKVKK